MINLIVKVDGVYLLGILMAKRGGEYIAWRLTNSFSREMLSFMKMSFHMLGTQLKQATQQ